MFFKTFDVMYKNISEYFDTPDPDELYNMVDPLDSNIIVHDYDRRSFSTARTIKELDSGLVLYISVLVSDNVYMDVYVQSIPSYGYVVSRVGKSASVRDSSAQGVEFRDHFAPARMMSDELCVFLNVERGTMDHRLNIHKCVQEYKK
ncbi:hypothetical protein SAGO17_0053 [Mimivirus AB-566-O17]|uniref:Uncharacterized protein n=1 Tax=Mimivirus AB-566-O17 TaxID=1988039 RepID=A0A1X9VNR9_9VIRU|nr:hypothetical protein SAGO17_0053 [Mimivirus AB-566-O17]